MRRAATASFPMIRARASMPIFPWPAAMGRDAYHGIAGQIVELLEPHTEAAPEALLLHLLALAGNFLGRDSYIEMDGSRHAPNLNVLFVGPTSTGRKGSAYGQARRLFDGGLLRDQTMSGLSTGEGLIFAVRDRETALEPDGITRKLVDPGVSDKRKVVVEEEFSRAIRAINRTDNTLSPILRLAWDGRDLEIATRKSPLRATEPHISVVGHITPEELRADLTDITAANGLGNRFLFLCVKRSKLLPFGGKPDATFLAQARKQLAERITNPKRGEIEMDAVGKVVWEAHYEGLSEQQPGLHGSLCARGAAQVLRLALLYALLDDSERIGSAHILAALCVWEYSKASALHIFGDRLGHPAADKIRAALRASPEGLKRSEIWDLFGHKTNKSIIDTSLRLLSRYGHAVSETRASAGGRSFEVWHAR